jgi:hypothetical protein
MAHGRETHNVPENGRGREKKKGNGKREKRSDGRQESRRRKSSHRTSSSDPAFDY